MKTVTAHLRGVAPLSQARLHDEPYLEKESKDHYERRTWRSKLHTDGAGMIFIPPMALKIALSEAAKRTGQQIPGRSRSTYTKHFEAGVLCVDPVALGIHRDAIEGEWIGWIMADVNGVRGSGRCCRRCFPRIPDGWRGIAFFTVLDETVTAPMFRATLEVTGSLIGIGRFRPINGGSYGRFVVDRFKWQ